MNKLVTVLAVLLTVNTFAATAKKAAKKAPVAKPATTETTTTTTAPATTAPAPEAAAAPQVNPQPAPAPVAASTATAPAAAEADTMTGTVDLRPSYAGDAAHLRTENYVDLGYKTGNDHFIFEQDFDTNLYNPSATADNSGLNFTIKDAMLRYKRANLWESADKTYSLSYELRPYLPTYKVKRDNGMITAIRNYAKFAAKVSDSVTLSLWEIPIVHVYNRAECTNGCANPAFENRVYLMADWNMTDKVSLSFPLMLNSTRFRTVAGAANSGATDHYVWIYPELDYALSANYTLGVSWYNDRSFMAADLNGFELSDGFKSGVTQLVLRTTM